MKDELPRWLPFECWIAYRFLKEGRVQTAFIICGVAIGVGVIVFMSALLSGMQANFVDRVLTGQAHIQLSPAKEVTRPLQTSDPDTTQGALIQPPLQRLKTMSQWLAIANQVQAMPDVKLVAPVVNGSALVSRGEATRSITILGIEPELYFQIVPMPSKIVQGQADVAVNDILIGTELARDLGVGVGDKLRVTAANSNTHVLTVRGIFDLGNKGANSRTTFMPIRTLQSLLNLRGGVSALDVTVQDVYAADIIAQKVARRHDVEAESWIQTNQHFFTALSAQTTANTAIRGFVALSVAFGIASVLVVSVIQKSREIGILRAMGISRGQVMRVFLIQGVLLGFGGSICGLALGYSALALWQRTQTNPDGTPLIALHFEPWILVLTLTLATLTGLLSSIVPAVRASRLDPVVAIRG
jgi:lipoprotein-releasing system permease protein